MREAAARDWAEIDPSIFGTLFERGLDPGKRSQLGAHYTDRDKIMLIVEPVITRPWLAEWATARAEIEKLLRQAEIAGDLGRRAQRTRLVQRGRCALSRLSRPAARASGCSTRPAARAIFSISRCWR